MVVLGFPVTIHLGDTPFKARAFSPVRPDRPGVFDPLEVIEQDPVKYAVLLQTMEREWRAMKTQYDHLAEFWDMIRKDAA